MPSSRPAAKTRASGRPVTQPLLHTPAHFSLLLQAMAASCSPAYCRALIQRLRGGGGAAAAAQADAAAKLAALVSGNTAAADMSAAAGAIPALIQVLQRSSSAELQRDAAKALAGICLNHWLAARPPAAATAGRRH